MEEGALLSLLTLPCPSSAWPQPWTVREAMSVVFTAFKRLVLGAGHMGPRMLARLLCLQPWPGPLYQSA